MSSDTKARIQAVARELFVEQGVRNTSLRQISDRLGITKPALYYHFASRDDLVRSIVQPMIDDHDRFVTTRAPGDPRELLEDYFELIWRHRQVLVMVIRELATLGQLKLAEHMFEWRRLLVVLLLGPDLTREQHIRATVALGGIADCAVEYADLPIEEVKPTAVQAAAAALGL
ncbi:TetR/AcrR family transcriptional regulator [Nonomuraea sp. KC401]|uniref:TetR/AcrR family transcriptional regulator n=1 Tax=unclassified Nonomuraea TaxID=2593643 RepID=UPI0010FF0E37|nr:MULTISPECIES: TetR/AcrR family transcriptional regulator [unclassified Nonomuraea]NBE95325.1 TetR family transcriptional regulator [Nonomuraea sp. K271]TLF72187.1 TetR/AcrR family transcriptional regulator [Nonomuraea sp. KC401]